MKRRSLIEITVVTILLFVTHTIVGYAQKTDKSSDIPHTISYQGIVTSTSGEPITDGNYDIVVTLYADSEGQVIVWQDTYTTNIVDGLFNLYLGSGEEPLPTSGAMDRSLWVGTQIDGTPEMRPLTPLTSSPYAMNVSDKAITSEKLAEGSVTAAKVDMDYISEVRVDGEKVTGKGSVLNLLSGHDIHLDYDAVTGSLKIESAHSITGTGKGEKYPTVQAAPNAWGSAGDQMAPGTHAAAPSMMGDWLGTGINGGVSIPMEIRTFNTVAMRYQTNTVGATPNVIGGDVANVIVPTSIGSTIGGGGGVLGVANHSINGNYNVIGGGIQNGIQADSSVIAGGADNGINSSLSTIGGGWGNQVSGYMGTIGGGHNNSVFGEGSTVAGGINNVVTRLSTIGGGTLNRVDGEYGTISGGQGNFVQGVADFGVIGGGQLNEIPSGNNATIGGGKSNEVNSSYGIVSGGESNSIGASSAHGSIGGGLNNQVESDFGTIGGGSINIVNGRAGTVGGGEGNQVDLDHGTIGGGIGNQVHELFGTIGGGFNNDVEGDYGTVGGGLINVVKGNASSIGGGQDNQVDFSYGTIGGGVGNRVLEEHGTISGGKGNRVDAQADFGTISGGETNSISNAAHGIIGGGESNSVTEDAHSTISGGLSNVIGIVSIVGKANTIGGGSLNLNVGQYDFVGGGSNNKVGSVGNPIISVNYGTIAGGFQNSIAADYGAITGGSNNQIETFFFGTIGGGENNNVESLHGTISGGTQNMVDGGQGSTIAGGASNYIGPPMGSIGGGSGNVIRGEYGTVSGGVNNKIESNADYGTISGGQENTILDDKINGAIGGGESNLINGDYGTIPGGDHLLTETSYAQTAVGFFNAPRGSVVVRPNTAGLTDDPLFMVGNGDYNGGPPNAPIRSNAFEVSYNGHSVVSHVNGSGGATTAPGKASYRGATYIDNVIYAWGDVPPSSVVGSIALNDDFGVASVNRTAAGTYVVTLNVADPAGNPITLNSASITATLVETSPPSCGFITTTRIGTPGSNQFTIKTYSTTCTLDDYPFMFKVTGRP